MQRLAFHKHNMKRINSCWIILAFSTIVGFSLWQFLIYRQFDKNVLAQFSNGQPVKTKTDSFRFEANMTVDGVREKLLKLSTNENRAKSRERNSWPDPDMCQLESCASGNLIDLTLRPKLTPNHRTHEQHMHELLAPLRNAMTHSHNLKFGSLLEEYCSLKNKLKLGSMSGQDESAYPQMLDLQEVVNNVTQSLPVIEAPINDEPLFLLRSPSEDTCSEPLDLLIMIKTISKNNDMRKKIRDVFAKQRESMQNDTQLSGFSFKVVFLVGLPFADTGDTFELEFFNSTLTGRAGSVLNEYKKRPEFFYKNMLEEADQFQDMLVGSYHDSYYNLTRKLISGWRWASQLCSKAQMISIMDDDMIIHMNVFHKLYHSWSANQRETIFGGTIWPGKIVSRPDLKNSYMNRWALHKAEYPWDTFPRFFSGVTAFFGRESLRKLAIGSAFVQDNRIDDVFVGLVMFKLAILPYNIPEVSYRQLKLNQDPNIVASAYPY